MDYGLISGGALICKLIGITDDSDVKSILVKTNA